MQTSLEQTYWLIILSIVVASVTWTITQEEIFREPRKYCSQKSTDCHYLIQRKFFYVFTCEYCLSYWITLVILFITEYRLLINDWRGLLLGFLTIP